MSKHEKDPEKAALLKQFGKRLATLRKQKNFSNYEHFCYVAGFSRSQISDYELGKTEPGLFNIKRLCNALGISLKEFFEEELD